MTNSMKRKIACITLTAVLLILTGVIPSCSQDSEETIKIGAVYALTGSSALAGKTPRIASCLRSTLSKMNTTSIEPD